MRGFSLLLLLLNLISLSFGGYYSKKYSNYGKKSYRKPSPTPRPTPQPTTPEPTTDLCGCFDISLTDVDDSTGKVCYTYSIEQISDDDICSEDINYIALDSGDECPVDLTDKVDDSLSVGCKSIDESFQNLVSGFTGVQCKIDDGKTSGSGGKKSGGKKSGGKKYGGSDDDRRRLRRRYICFFLYYCDFFVYI